MQEASALGQSLPTFAVPLRIVEGLGVGKMGNQATVLLVDDEPFLLTAVSSLLRSAGYVVHTCEQWVGVASAVRKVVPDLILLDYNMPSLRGDDICCALKNNADNGRMKIYLYSSEPEADLKRIASRCGADGYICKDLGYQELVSRITSVMTSPMTA